MFGADDERFANDPTDVPMSVSQAGPEDAGTIARLLWDFNTEFDTTVPAVDLLRTRFEALLSSESVLAVLCHSPEATGLALVTLRPSPYYDGPVAALDELYVVPARRGEGVGTAIMAFLLKRLRDVRCGEVQINVDEEDEDARRFYDRHGFTNRQPGSEERMLCYLREL